MGINCAVVAVMEVRGSDMSTANPWGSSLSRYAGAERYSDFAWPGDLKPWRIVIMSR